MLSNVTTAILDELTASCPECGINNNTIDRENVTCSSSYVTYRARLEGTSQTDSLYLISLIEDWVESGRASIIVTGVILTVDSQCPVAISSLSEGECSPTIPPPPPPSSDSLPSLIATVTAGVLGLILLLTLTVISLILSIRYRYCPSK